MHHSPDLEIGENNLTKRQLDILHSIFNYNKQNRYPPTLREICVLVNLKSASTMHSHLIILEKNRYIIRNPDKPRAITFTDKCFINSVIDDTDDIYYSVSDIKAISMAKLLANDCQQRDY